MLAPQGYEKTEARPHDPRWGEMAAAERARLSGLLAPWLAEGVEHVGSTAKPGSSPTLSEVPLGVRRCRALPGDAGFR
jgi:GrpB-like predicted nucleotidyltransferase (UPF0157 family)